MHVRMTKSHLFAGWLVAVVFLSASSYVHPAFGAFAATSLVVIAALINSILELNSPTVGRFTGLLVGAITLASCIGAPTSKAVALLLTLSATLAGFLFVTFAARRTSSDGKYSEPSDSFKSGGGGDYGGGGASGNY